MMLAMMTQTQLEAVNRRKAFHNRIAERAADLVAKKKYIPTEEILSPVNDDLFREAWNTINGIDNLSGPRIEGIQEMVAKHFGLTRNDIISARRTKNLILPRMISIYLSRQLTTRSFPDIGRRTGGRDHTTMLHSIHKITGMLERDGKLAEKVFAIREEILA